MFLISDRIYQAYKLVLRAASLGVNKFSESFKDMLRYFFMIYSEVKTNYSEVSQMGNCISKQIKNSILILILILIVS